VLGCGRVCAYFQRPRPLNDHESRNRGGSSVRTVAMPSGYHLDDAAAIGEPAAPLGDNLPAVGEQVAYFTERGTVRAVVIAVTFWDLVDLELEDGTILLGVRRILAMGMSESDVGRFERFAPRVRE
jgi:hypothetical protein